MEKNEEVMKEVISNLTQITDYLESIGPGEIIDHLSAISLNVRYAEIVQVLIEYTTVLEKL